MLEKRLWPEQESGKCCLGLASPAGQGVDAKSVQRRKQGSTQPSLWIAQSRCGERSAPRTLCLLVNARQLYFFLPSFLPFFLLLALFFFFFSGLILLLWNFC